MYLAFLKADLTGLYVLFAIVVALLIAIVCALIWRLYKKASGTEREK